jgi:hypothetical protein
MSITTSSPPTMLDTAFQYAARGWHVFPAPPGKKLSYYSAEKTNGRRWGATNNVDEINCYFAKFPRANIGIATGAESAFFVVEADTIKGHDVDGIASLKALEAVHGPLPETLMAESPSGSIHYYFRWPRDVIIRNSASKIGPGIDVRGAGGMVIAPPSARPGKGRYRWLNVNVITDAPQWLIELATADDGAAERTANENAKADSTLIAAALAIIPNVDLGWEDWNRIGMATFAASGGDGFEMFDAFSRESTKYDSKETRQRWNSYFGSPPNRIGMGTLYFLASKIDPSFYEKEMWKLMS